MLIEIQCSAHLAKHAKDWLIETYKLLQNLVSAYDLLCADSTAWVTPELAAMGVSATEGLVYMLDESLGSIELPCSYEVIDRGNYGNGMAVQKYLNAFTSIDAIILSIKTKADYAEPFTSAEIFELKSNMYQALGDLTYSFGRVLFMQNPKAILLTPDEFTYSQDIQAFLAHIGKTAEEVAVQLVELQGRFISTIPLFDNDAESWLAITKELDPSLVDMLVDYGEYITALDIRAVHLGVLIVDENFVDLIRERADNPSHISNQAPVKWSRFIELLPDEEVSFFEANEFRITPEMLDPALKEGVLSIEYLTVLHQLLGGNMGVSNTNVFDTNT